MDHCIKGRSALTPEDRDWTHRAIRILEADGRRSADTHLVKPDFPGLRGIDIYFKVESTHPTGSLKHRLARSLFLYGICNGRIRQNTLLVEASSGSSAVSDAYFARLPSWLRSGAAALGEKLPSDRHSPVLNALRLAKGFLASTELSFEERYGTYVQVFSPDAVERLLRVNGFDRHDAMASAFRIAQGDDDLNRMMVVDAETQLPDDLLLLTDKMSMATSLECRVPLLDHELVELAATIPEEIKIRNGRLKHAMKLALADVLPADILERKKRGFGTPMGAWLKNGLKPMLHRLLDEATVHERGLFDHEQVSRLIRDHEANRVDGTDQLLALMNLEVWSRIYLDRRAPADVTLELQEAFA